MTAHIQTPTASFASFLAPQEPEGKVTATATCPYCGRPDADPFQVVSRHRTSTGQTVWTRCGCGSLQMRVLDEVGERVVTRSRAPHHS